ncbi:Transmembrane receptor, eukaryota [Beauveria bassiana ARSEF 2860]|uniref:Transmembrane receptor, eukaryota n=1 Tax=Beauveria bassiana (strain ARSEF 2860) TaxID=655819 RepID=J4W2Z9_BEAB2|nr:Transmembrane receptor, eukaryota [Beauveria bassiana ARSEF 2860]EJP64805.1 Transmembrane receptor, eukaryota [Beauveria bassiana ARSEF 2860]
MRSILGLLALGMSLWTMTQALEVGIDQSRDGQQFCAGMYSKKSWGGPVDPFILVKFLNNTLPQGDDPTVSLVIFEWKDKSFVGVPSENGENNLVPCNQDYINSGTCNSTDLGEFILAENATEKSRAFILSKAIHLKSSGPIRYSIKETGYYCLFTQGFNVDEYSAVAEFRNAFGEISATQIPKLPFYGGMSILYALMAVYWGFLYYQHRHDILAVQNYITAILVFLVVEMLMTWGFYDFQNTHGSNAGAKAFLIVVAILNAARNSFSFFLLLIVCMGYGVVKPTLGRTMIYVRYLAAAHFVFGLIYAITSLLSSPESVGPFVLLIVLPLAGTLTAFYVWTLNSLNFTLKDLRERKQHAKASMYKKLWWCILITVLVTFAFFFINSFTFASVHDIDFVPSHWKTRWFVLDGWLNIVYLADVAWVAYVWRPTANNRRFAMSDEIAQDDDGNFEIGEIGMPGDSEDEDEEAHIGGTKPVGAGPSTGGAPSGQTSGITSAGAAGASIQKPSRSVPRDSIEGETIFAVGEDGDRFSIDDSDEDVKLVNRK